jgi:protein TonB
MSSEHTPVPPVVGAPVPPKPELRFLLPEEKTDFKRVFGGAGLSHLSLLLLMALAVWARPDRQVRAVLEDFPIQDIVFLDIPGPGGGGGGGGSQSPEPPKQEPTPAVKPPEPDPIPTPTPEPVVVEPPPPEPIIAEAPIVATDAPTAVIASAPSVGQSLGTGTGPGAGSGRGGGQGSGSGDGVGSGSGGGCCEGVFQIGNGVSSPTVIHLAKPLYTPEAMLRRVQGEVHLSCIVTNTGMVTKCDVVKSLDSNNYGLDNEALKAARQSQFRPATLKGKPVSVQVTIILEFNMR